MDAQELRNLQEAYNQVYQELDEATAMAKRGLNEPAIRNQIAKSTGGGQAADRATALENRPTYGQRGVNTQARQNLARAQRGDFRRTTSSDYGLRGYAHKSDDPNVKAKQAARGAQRGVLTPNEKKKFGASSSLGGSGTPSGTGRYTPGSGGRYGIAGIGLADQYDLYDIILAHLLDEGYAETPEAAEKIMVNMSEEWREDIMEGMSMKDFKANRKKLQRKEASADARKRGHEGKTWADSGKTYSPDQAKRNRANMTDATRQALYRVANNPDDDGGDDHYPASKTNDPKKLRKQKAMGEIGESYDLYDIILSHLLDEGYADTQQAAEAIMVNMGEEWRESIIEADSIEAMRARAAKRRKQRYGASDTSRGGRDDFRPYTEDDYKRPGPGSQAKES
jgi:hypothetical protein